MHFKLKFRFISFIKMFFLLMSLTFITDFYMGGHEHFYGSLRGRLIFFFYTGYLEVKESNISYAVFIACNEPSEQCHPFQTTKVGVKKEKNNTKISQTPHSHSTTDPG